MLLDPKIWLSHESWILFYFPSSIILILLGKISMTTTWSLDMPCLALQMAQLFNQCSPFVVDPIQHLLATCWYKTFVVQNRFLSAGKINWFPSHWESCSSFSQSCILCKLLLGNHFSKLSPSKCMSTFLQSWCNTFAFLMNTIFTSLR